MKRYIPAFALIFVAACGGGAVNGGAPACTDGAQASGGSCTKGQAVAPSAPSGATLKALAKIRDEAAAKLAPELSKEYLSALKRERANDYNGARQLYDDLESKVNDLTRDGDGDASDFGPFIDYARGEMFLSESLAYGSFFPNAESSFSRVLERPATENPLFAYALLRLAECAERQGETDKAKAAYAQLASEMPKSPAAHDIPSWAKQ
jgi:TolA-binding protein